MLTSRIIDRAPSSRTAMNTPPTMVIGAATSSVHVISTSICTWVTSLVIRVMSDGAPKWLDLPGGEAGDLVEQAVAHVAAEAHGRLRAEVDGADGEHHLDQGDAQHHAADPPDVAVSPVAMPLSMMSALSVGR